MRFIATSTIRPDADTAAMMATMDDEVAYGARLYAQGVILEAYIDASFERTVMIVEAPDPATARRAFDGYPHVIAGWIEFELLPVVGLPAVAQVHAADGSPLPSWWPQD